MHLCKLPGLDPPHPLLYMPTVSKATQVRQEVIPNLGLYLDARQFTQEVVPRLGSYVDAGQFIQELI